MVGGWLVTNRPVLHCMQDNTSTTTNFYTVLKRKSKSHFYESLSCHEGVLAAFQIRKFCNRRTFTGPLKMIVAYKNSSLYLYRNTH